MNSENSKSFSMLVNSHILQGITNNREYLDPVTVTDYCVPLGNVLNGVEASENNVSASEVSRDTLRVQRGELRPPNVSSSLPRLLRDIVSDILL